MASNEEKIVSVLKRNGTDQLDRNLASLQPDSVQLQAFGVEEWMQFAYNFAGKVNYFSAGDSQNPSGNWEAFFASGDELKTLLAQVENPVPDGKITPHLTLFVCFLKLMELSTERMNRITKRHLDFYYHKVLQIDALPAEADKAYLVFELAKGLTDYLVKAETSLDGGKDALGTKRLYALTEELPVTKTTVAQLKNVYNEQPPNEENGLDTEGRFSIKAASVANSIDGIGGALTPESPTWYPFGYYLTESEQETMELPELPEAKLGFAAASSVMRLAEGKREIIVKFSFTTPLTVDFEPVDLSETIDVWLTSEKGWVGPFKPVVEDDTSTGLPIASRVDEKDVYLNIRLDQDVVAITDYVQAIHGEQFNTTNPVARFLFKTTTENNYAVYSAFAGKRELESVTIGVEVTGAKQLVIESDAGTLNPEKPFYPFTTRPVKGSLFSVFNQEMADKKWSTMSLQMKWKSTPLNFRLHYAIYDSSFVSGLTKEKYEEMFEDYDPNTSDTEYFSIYQSFGLDNDPRSFLPKGRIKSADNTSVYKPIVTSNDYFKVEAELLYKEEWVGNGVKMLLFNQQADSSFTSTFELQDGDYERGETGPIRIRLDQSFMHELYPSMYAIALSAQNKALPIPNEPYTPFAEDLQLNYTALDTIYVNDTSEAKYEDRTIQLFHEHPFGQSEEHAYLKSTYKEKSTNCAILPTYCKGGELYIGLENAQVSELVTLFVQVAEGTENPLAKSFVDNQKVQWEILCNNVWRSLDSLQMTLNEIDNFLVSGRIKFTIPEYANNNNTLLPTGLFWIRAKMYKRFDAVCKVHGIHAQVAEATFRNNGNDTSHLTNGLPAGTISKLVERLSQIKSVQQPYATVDGKPEESDALYYRRVSERLRHKNRAITLWDYEHLVLQEFPQVYKVKCLNHSLDQDYVSPGCVSLIVIPDTINKTVYDIYQPRLSKGKLNKIKEYLDELNSMHVTLDVANPDYEEVQIELAAKFQQGLDDNTYKKQLNEDIIRFLSPWAFEESREIKFGVVLYRSSLIHYIEKLNYVDYIEDVRIFKKGVLQSRNCEPSTPRSILVSAKSHLVNIATNKCQKESSLETEESCQL
ncbi:MAG TPA: baseplate J/gp47 family protein [Fluviicola sp.]|nr:baseplate J/gp47 family protein [Fluviicola sp.]